MVLAVCNTSALRGGGLGASGQGRNFMGVGLVKTTVAGIRPLLVAATLATALLGGCATRDTGAAEVWDPIETPNRFVFAINRTVDMIAVRPLAVMYRDGVPEPAQKSVRNLLDNLGEPVTAIN